MKFERLLGFSDNERQLYRALDVEPYTVAELVDKSSLPRMTVHYALERFMNRGLISRVKREKHFRYYKVEPINIFKELDVFSDSLLAVNLNTEIVTGYESILESYLLLIKESRSNRLRTIQTTASTKLIYETYSLEQLQRFDEMMRESGVIVDDIVEETFFRPIYKKYPDNFETVIQSFLDRTLVTHVVPERILEFTNDVVISPVSVLLIDWKSETATHIKSSELRQMFLSFYNLLSVYATKISFKALSKPYL